MNQSNRDLAQEAFALWARVDVFKWIASQDGQPADVYAAEELGRDSANAEKIFSLLPSESEVVVAYAAFTLLKLKSGLFLKVRDMYSGDSRPVKVRTESSVVSLPLGDLLEMMGKKFVAEICKAFEASFSDIVRWARSSGSPKDNVLFELEQLIAKDEALAWNVMPEEMRAGVRSMMDRLR